MNDENPSALILCSRSWGVDALEELGQLLGRTELGLRWKAVEDIGSVLEGRQFLSVKPPDLHSVEFSGGQAHTQVLPTLPSWVESTLNTPLTGLVETTVKGLTAPTSPRAIPLIRTEGDLEHRSGRYGVVTPLFHPVRLAAQPMEYARPRFLISYPTPFTLLRRIAEGLNGTVSLSNTGQVSREIFRRFGSLHRTVEALNAGPLRTVIDAFMKPPRDVNGVMAMGSRTYIRASGFKSLLPELNEQGKLANALSNWAEQGIIHYGLALRCRHCSFSELYPWDDVSDSGVICRQCRNLFPVTPDAACGWEPTAGLDGVVQSVLTGDHLEEFALSALIQERSESNAIVIGTEWALPTVDCEVDVAGCVDGEVVFGEAKSISKLEGTGERKQVEKYEQLALATRARRLVFATSKSEWLPGALTQLDELAERLPNTTIEAWVGLLGKDGPSRAR